MHTAHQAKKVITKECLHIHALQNDDAFKKPNTT